MGSKNTIRGGPGDRGCETGTKCSQGSQPVLRARPSSKKQSLIRPQLFSVGLPLSGVNRPDQLVLAANFRTDSDTIKRVTPEIMMLRPTRVPTTHSVLYGQ